MYREVSYLAIRSMAGRGGQTDALRHRAIIGHSQATTAANEHAAFRIDIIRFVKRQILPCRLRIALDPTAGFQSADCQLSIGGLGHGMNSLGCATTALHVATKFSSRTASQSPLICVAA